MPKPKQFSYRPFFYDERKERLEKMKARAEAEVAAEKSGMRYYSGLQRGFLSESREKSKLRHPLLEKTSTIRFLLILVMLVAIIYFFMPEWLVAFWKK